MSHHQSLITVDNNTGDVFVETFLIDATHLNDKGWKVSYDDPVSYDNTVQKSLGHPLVLYERTVNGYKIWDHPVSETGSVADDIEFQKPYIIGKSVHNKKIRDGLWHTTYKIIHEGAKRFLKTVKESAISLFTSPHIVRPVLEDRQNIKTWGVIHNAIVSSPANGKQLAKVASICEGDPNGACSSLFASMDTPDKDRPQCGYCLGDSLKEYLKNITSHSLKTESSSSMSDNSQTGQPGTGNNGQTSSGNPTNNSNNPSINDNGNGTQTIIKSPGQQSNQNQQEAGNDDSQQKTIAALQEKIKQLESQNQTQNTSNDAISKAEKRIGDLEKELALNKRSGSIEKLLTQAISLYTDDAGTVNEKEYNGDLDKLVKSSHSIEEIQELIQAKFVLHQHAKGKLTGNKASNTSPDFDRNTSQVSESGSINYTEMNGSTAEDSKTTTESASNSRVNKKLSQNYVNVLNHLNAESMQYRSRFGGSS